MLGKCVELMTSNDFIFLYSQDGQGGTGQNYHFNVYRHFPTR